MPKNPFKFLDSYTKEDKDIFFGRETEIEELYQKVFESKILLVCGVSGTGKSSLIDCGLANKFEDSDWLPINIRRGTDINDSLRAGISKLALTKVKESKSLTKQLQSLYLDHFKPIYLIFDQFEELFIFGNKEERKEFIKQIKTIAKSDIQCKFVFAIREEYVAGVIEFDREIPDFLANRVRLEKMTWHNAKQVIEEPCKIYSIEVEKGFSETVLEKLSPESTEVELTYLQVFLDKAFRLATDKNKEKPGFTNKLLEQIGDVSDLLGSFLEEQISELEDPDTGLVILKSFVSIKGTKRQITEEEIIDNSRTFGKEISPDTLKDIIQKFVNLRILRDKDENGRYELRHDGLATKIYEKITMVEKELLEVRQFIDSAYNNFEKRKKLLGVDDLGYIAPYENKLFLNRQLERFIESSKKEIQKAKRRRRNIVVAASISLFIIMAGFTIWAINERAKAVEQKQIAEEQKNVAISANVEAELANELALSERNKAIANELLALNAQDQAEKARNEAISAREIVTRELYASIRNSLSVSPEAMNVIFIGVDNPVSITASGISPENLIASATNGSIKRGTVRFGTRTYEGIYIANPTTPGKPFIVSVKGITNKGDTIDLGNRDFRVKLVPEPYATFADSKSGVILKETLLQTDSIEVKLDIDFYIGYQVKEFVFEINDRGFAITEPSNSKYITPGQRSLIDRLNHGDRFVISDIQAFGPDGRIRNLAPIVLKVFSHKDVIKTKTYQEMYEGANDFYNEAVKFRDRNKSLKYLIRSSEILDSLTDRKPADYMYQLKVLTKLYSLRSLAKYRERLEESFDKILSWNDVELFYEGANYFYNYFNQNKEISLKLRFHDKALQLYNKILSINEVDKQTKSGITGRCSNFSWYLLQEKEFVDALRAALIAKEADPSYLLTYTNLALSYLFTNQFEKAKEVYIERKDKPYDDQYETFRDVFLEDLKYMEEAGITHPDFEKIRRLLEQ